MTVEEFICHGRNHISAFTQGRLVTTSLGSDRKKQYQVVSADRDLVSVRDFESGKRYQFPIQHVAVVDLDDDRDHIDNYKNDKGSSDLSTTARLADGASSQTPKKARCRHDQHTNQVRERIRDLRAANPYIMEEEADPEEDFRPRRRRDIVDFMSDWR